MGSLGSQLTLRWPPLKVSSSVTCSVSSSGNSPDVHLLGAADLQQEVVLGVGVRGRHRPGRGQEDEALALGHHVLAGADVGVHLLQALVQEPLVLGVALDVLEHHPAAVGLDLAGDLADRLRAALDLVRRRDLGHVAEVVLDPVPGQALGQLGDRLDREQRVVGQLVRHRQRGAVEVVAQARVVDVQQRVSCVPPSSGPDRPRGADEVPEGRGPRSRAREHHRGQRAPVRPTAVIIVFSWSAHESCHAFVAVLGEDPSRSRARAARRARTAPAARRRRS